MIVSSIRAVVTGRALRSVAPETSVAEACRILDSENLGALPVVANGRLAGVVSDRDVIGRGVSINLDAEMTPVARIMTVRPKTIHIDDSLADALMVMLEGGLRHLPVIDEDGAVAGLIAMADIPVDYRVMVARYREFQELRTGT